MWHLYFYLWFIFRWPFLEILLNQMVHLKKEITSDMMENIKHASLTLILSLMINLSYENNLVNVTGQFSSHLKYLIIRATDALGLILHTKGVIPVASFTKKKKSSRSMYRVNYIVFTVTLENVNYKVLNNYKLWNLVKTITGFPSEIYAPQTKTKIITSDHDIRSRLKSKNKLKLN